MIQRNDIVLKIEAHQEELKQLGVKSLSLFGSVARNEATQNSDVDLLVELERPAGFFKVSRIERYLEEVLGRSVDLGTEAALREHYRQTITKDLIRLF